MDFFAAQDDARLRTRHLLLYFGLAVFAIVVAVNVAIYLATLPSSLRTDLYDYYRIKWTTILTLVAIGWACFLRIRELRSRGGKGLCENLGGRRVDYITRNPAERRLVNVAEELSIAAGMAVPHLYVLERERGINALAAGFEVDDASVAVTKGALEELTRDELQGLVAHEFSHILNGDMRLNTTLCGWLEGILVLTIVGKGILRMTDQEEDAVHLFTARRREVPPLLNPLVLGGLLVGATGYIGHVAACAIQRAICREREFLADAAAVQFTRNPHGLADALRRIGGYRQTSRVPKTTTATALTRR